MSLLDAIRTWSDREGPALLSPSGDAITYRELATLTAELAKPLRGHHDEVTAVIAGNGPEGVALMAAVASVSVCAPLPTGLSPDELDDALRHLGATRLVLPGEEPIPTGIQATGPAGAALLIRTSGSTGSTGGGKLVPLTADNLLYAAGLVARTLDLSPSDRCLNPMPLHHTHGLVGAVLSTLSSGGSVICLPHYTDQAMEGALTSLDPTWYTAVPSIHARVAALAESGRLPGHRLRFARSASAPLTGALRRRLGRALGVPVLSTYALSEAPGQVTGHRPDDPTTDGSVGRVIGCEVAVFDGRIAVRGPHVSSAHLDGGWLRTGDLGTLTPDGELFLHGREDDVINRAGEKISPEGVEGKLAADPRVADVVVFGADDPALGQAVVALVVPATPDLQPGDLRTASSHPPDRIVFTDRIPRTATGKVNRHTLAADLPTPDHDLLAELRAIWAEILFLPDLDVDADFGAIGGGSLQAARIEAQVAARLGVELPPFALQDAPTVRALAAMIGDGRRVTPQ